MALQQSPNIVTNGLVFAYDMLNTKKSWKGAPVTNSFNCPNPYDANNNVGFIINGTGTFQRVYSGTYGGYTITSEDVVYRYNLGAGGCHYHGNSAAIGAGQYVCYSVDYYVSPDASDYLTEGSLIVLENYGGSALGGGTGVSSDVTTKGKWQTIQGYSGPTGGSGTQAMFLYPGGCGGAGSYTASRGFILMKNPMFEFRSDVKYNRFVNGTRSNTESIKDLTGKNTITVNNLTYSSDGTFSFNGSSSWLEMPTSSIFDTQALTMECWCYPSTTNQRGFLFEKGQVNTQYSNFFEDVNFVFRTMGLSTQDLTFASGSYITANRWNHIVCTYGSGTKIVYVNGVAIAQQTGLTGSIPTGQTNQYVGKYGSASNQYPFSGSIAVSKVYNRALTAAEVLQNFNAIRGRYGI